MRKIILFTFLLLYSLTFAPVLQASVVLKLIAVNPSKEQTQKVPVKAYLPKETKPDDVVDKGDLDIAYDTQQGSYYVYGDYELKPGEVVEKEIEIRDIWEIPESEIEALRMDVAKTVDLLKNSEFNERAVYLKQSVETKLDQIIENQRSAPTNPEQHISSYRDNLAILAEVKQDVALARTMLSQLKPMPLAMVWRLILAIVIFLGVLGGTFYFIWQKQLKTIAQDDTFFVPKEDEAGQEKHEEQEKV